VTSYENKREKPGELKKMTLPDAPKMGWFCSYTPLEILYAAEFQPFRITGHSDTIKKADSFMHPNMFQYVRSWLDTALAGGYEHLQGAVFVNSCDAMRRLHDAWRKYVSQGFIFIIDLPRGRSNEHCGYFQNELVKLKKSLEKHYSIDITDNALKQAVKVLEKSRSLYHELNDLRKQSPPLISGKEMMQIASRFFTEHPDRWNHSTEALIKQKKGERPSAVFKPRILLSGSPIHNPEIIGFIEECGLDVLYEDLCSGSRFFDLTVEDTGDPLSDLSYAYLNKPPCSRMLMIEERVKNIVNVAEEFDVRGIIHHSLKFCDTYLYDVPELKRHLADNGLKVLLVEGDCTLGSFGQLKTRIEAFAEVLNDA
jgi:benzoyl-CoA reductase/2-hydroxyglutaryl-CoA dehydratase subunit BcrC/BadD/HgdB